MIVFAASMLKAGSSWLFNLINDLVVEAGHQDGREMRERFRLQNFLSASDCTSKTLRIHRLAAISIPHWFGNTYTIKTAGKPTPAVKLAIIERYQINNRANWQHDLHFNVGRASKFVLEFQSRGRFIAC